MGRDKTGYSHGLRPARQCRRGGQPAHPGRREGTERTAPHRTAPDPHRPALAGPAGGAPVQHVPGEAPRRGLRRALLPCLPPPQPRTEHVRGALSPAHHPPPPRPRAPVARRGALSSAASPRQSGRSTAGME